jgi:CubicO group peptidase (beta-lactamase class C family)
MLTRTVLAFALSLQFSIVYAQPTGHSQLVAVIEPFIAAKEVAGGVLLVVDKVGDVAVATHGLADIAAKKVMKEDAIFWIASMSKPITGTCIMLLQQEGKLSLDDSITKFLPEMNALRFEDKPVTITIGQLLSHTSGMAELKAGEVYTSADLTEAAKRYASVKVLFEPGSRWQYSQTSINTAARIVEVVSGMSFDEFVKKRITEPLGMKDTTFYLSESQLTRLAKSYRRTDQGNLEQAPIMLLAGKSPTDRNRMPAANGGLFSTAADYAKFCRMLLNGGQLNGIRLLSPESVTQFRTIVTKDLVTGFTPGNGWGVGCCVVREPQGTTAALSAGSFGHGGAYGTQAWIDPVRERAYILMVQRSNFPNADASELRSNFQKVARELNR